MVVYGIVMGLTHIGGYGWIYAGIGGLYPPKLYPLLISIRYYLIVFEVVDKTKPLS